MSLAFAALAPVSASAAPGDPACAPEKTLAVTFEINDGVRAVPLVATHEVTVGAEWPGAVRQPALSVPAGVRVLGVKPRELRLIVPASANLAVTASWEQATDPSDPDGDPSDAATRCVASRTIALPITPAKPSRALYRAGKRKNISSLAVVPDREAGDLSPLEVSVRVSTKARFPSARSKARTMPVAMRPSEQVRYRKRIPDPFGGMLGLADWNRFYNLTRGPGRLFTQVSTLGGVRYRAGRIVQRELHPRDDLPPTQPFRDIASDGVMIGTDTFHLPRPGEPKAFEYGVGYDIQVRQSGRLVARVRRAVRWGLSRGQRYYSHVVRAQNG
jgi:hypothetical protein